MTGDKSPLHSLTRFRPILDECPRFISERSCYTRCNAAVGPPTLYKVCGTLRSPLAVPHRQQFLQLAQQVHSQRRYLPVPIFFAASPPPRALSIR